MRLIYTIAFYLSVPAILLRLAWRARHNRAYLRRWPERFGFVRLPPASRQRLWLHTVSVGEFLAARPLIERLLERGDCELLITTMTVTGSERVRAVLGDRVQHCYVPYDLPGPIKRFLKRARPAAMITMETELWPNTLNACRQCEVPALLVNGRLSERSAAGYARAPGLTGEMLEAISAAGVNHRDDAERFTELGLPRKCLTVTGNIKFDLTLSDDLKKQARELRGGWSDGERLVWIAASTHKGEDEKVLAALRQLRERGLGPEQLLLVLVPRHPERFEKMHRLCIDEGFRTVKRSSGDAPAPDTDVLLGDTMGELPLLFGASDIVWMGGTYADVGGHNFIEPAAWGLPLLSGPILYNFAEIARLLLDAEALEVAAPERLAEAVEALCRDEKLRQKRGKSARQVAQQNRGALDKTLKLIERQLP